jgi:hypothetical protein
MDSPEKVVFLREVFSEFVFHSSINFAFYDALYEVFRKFDYSERPLALVF